MVCSERKFRSVMTLDRDSHYSGFFMSYLCFSQIMMSDSVVVLQDYASDRPNHLSVRRGQSLEVVDSCRDDNYLLVRTTPRYLSSSSPAEVIKHGHQLSAPASNYNRGSSPTTFEGLVPISCVTPVSQGMFYMIQYLHVGVMSGHKVLYKYKYGKFADVRSPNNLTVKNNLIIE